MRYLSGLFILGFILVTGCDSGNIFEIEGKFTINDPTPVKLYQLLESDKELIDSVSTTNQAFQLTGPIEHPGIYLLEFFNEQQIFLVLLPGDELKITIDNSMDHITYYVENSPESKRIKELMDQQHKVLRQIDQLSYEWEQNRADSLMRRKIDSSYYSILDAQRKYTIDFIHAKPQSLANILAIYQNFGKRSQPLFDRYDDVNIFAFVDSSLVGKYPQTEAVIALNKEVNETRDQIEHKKYVEKIVEAGRPLPPLRHHTVNNDTLEIPAADNKPTLLLFWASWNPYSVQELQMINEFNQTPKAERVQVVTISLDSDTSKLAAFIKDKNITVPVICDYQYWDSDLVGKYAVKRIPATLLSNSEGIIVTKDIFAEELLNRINELIP